jgi:hypothetical protein
MTISRSLPRYTLFVVAIAYAGCDAPPSSFHHKLGGPGIEVGNSVRELADGGYIIAGYTSSFGAGQEDAWLIRTDKAGDTLWTRTLGGPGNDFAWDVLPTDDGGFMTVGFTNSFGAGGDDVYLARTDSEGTPIWTRTYGGLGDELAWALHSTADGGFVVTAQTTSYGAGERDIYILRIDAAGDTLWTTVLGGPGVDRVFATVPTADGGSVFAGITSNETVGGLDASLVRIDSVGDVVWARTYGGEGNDIGHGVATAPNGGFLLVGYTDSFGAGNNDIYLVRTDGDGEVIWTEFIGDAGDDRAMMAVPTSEGGFAIAGYASGTAEYWSVRLTAISGSGDQLWSESFGSPGTDRGVMLQETSDGAYIFTGGIWNEDHQEPDLFLAKIASPGHVNQN